MKKFNVRDRVFLDEAINAFLRESKKFEKEQELLGNRPIVTYAYWKIGGSSPPLGTIQTKYECIWIIININKI